MFPENKERTKDNIVVRWENGRSDGWETYGIYINFDSPFDHRKALCIAEYVLEAMTEKGYTPLERSPRDGGDYMGNIAFLDDIGFIVRFDHSHIAPHNKEQFELQFARDLDAVYSEAYQYMRGRYTQSGRDADKLKIYNAVKSILDSEQKNPETGQIANRIVQAVTKIVYPARTPQQER